VAGFAGYPIADTATVVVAIIRFVITLPDAILIAVHARRI
jgi:hypothetical protein